MTASCCQADSGSAISHSKAKHLCADGLPDSSGVKHPLPPSPSAGTRRFARLSATSAPAMPTLSLRGGHKHPVVVARRHTIRTGTGLSEQRRLSVSSGLVENAFSLLNGGVRVP